MTEMNGSEWKELERAEEDEDEELLWRPETGDPQPPRPIPEYFNSLFSL
jgi:hypothetical protein